MERKNPITPTHPPKTISRTVCLFSRTDDHATRRKSKIHGIKAFQSKNQTSSAIGPVILHICPLALIFRTVLQNVRSKTEIK